MQKYAAPSSDANVVELTVKPNLAVSQNPINTSNHLGSFPLQTRLYTGDLPHQRGNSFATAIACLMGLNNPEDVFQVQEHYDRDKVDDPQNWVLQLRDWLKRRNLHWQQIDGHLYDGSHYMVAGRTPQGHLHVCIYKNGKLLHDPHPSGRGLMTEDFFEIIEPLLLTTT